MQAVINAVPAPIFFKDREGRYLGCNRAFEDYIGMTREQLVGHTVFELFDPELAQVYFEADNALFGSGGEQVYEAKVAYADGSIRDVMFHKAVFAAEMEGIEGLVGVILDITERKQMELQYRELALTDTVTQVDSRFSFTRSAEAAIALVNRTASPVSLLLLDLDNFKGINDAHGHLAGDAILLETARRLRSAIRKTDTVGRLGGDEFAILLQDTAGTERLEQIANKLIAIASEPIVTPDAEVCIGVSIGVATAPDHADDLTGLMRCADRALYRAKAVGKCCFHIFRDGQS